MLIRKIQTFQKGFTLIELLVVVAIIGILAAVGVVAYSGYTKAAKLKAAKQNLKTILPITMKRNQKKKLPRTKNI